MGSSPMWTGTVKRLPGSHYRITGASVPSERLEGDLKSGLESDLELARRALRKTITINKKNFFSNQHHSLYLQRPDRRL